MRSSFVYTDQDVDTTLRSPLDLSKLGQLLQDKESNDKITLGPSYTSDFQMPLTRVEQFKFGQSNPTYLITDSQGRKLVLRRKPIPNKDLISPKAHNIEREFHFLSAIGHYNKSENEDVPVSKMILLCEDESYIGYVFYLMEFIQGIIFQDPFMSSITEEMRLRCWLSAVQVLLQVHRIDAKILSKYLSPDYFPKLSSSFFQRQVKTLSRISNLQGSSEGVSQIPNFKEISAWLLANAPNDTKPPTLIHGDFKIDNLVFHLDTCKVIAILDWELTTIGHPIFDISNLLQPAILPPDLNLSINGSAKSEPFPNCVDKCLTKYYELNPRWGDPKICWKVGIVFGIYRVAVITQGVYMRSIKGVASSAQAKKFGLLYMVFGDLLMKEITRDVKL